MKSRELKQILSFKDSKFKGSGWKIINHGYTESSEGVSPEKAYEEITSYGKKNGKTTSLEELEELLICKQRRDFQKKLWTDGLREGTMMIQDFEDDDIGLDIFSDCIKDFIKTESRISVLKRLEGKGPNIGLMAALACRNWFMDKLKLKLPEDIHDKDCYTCRELFWTTGKYVLKEKES